MRSWDFGDAWLSQHILLKFNWGIHFPLTWESHLHSLQQLHVSMNAKVPLNKTLNPHPAAGCTALRWNVDKCKHVPETVKCERLWTKLCRKRNSHYCINPSSIYRHIYKPYYKRRIVPPHHINFPRVHFKTTPSRGHMSIAAQPSLWPDIKGPSRREGWLRAAMEAADSLINQTQKQRGAGLGSDMRHDS